MQCFQGTTLSIPTKADAVCAPSEWQNLSWVVWCTGELRVDPTSAALIFMAQGPGTGRSVPPKSLNCLTGALAVAGEGVPPQTFVLTTSDPVHGMLRVSFGSRAAGQAFEKIARGVEAEAQARMRVAEAPTPMNRRRSVLAGDALRDRIRQACPGRWPLVFGGAELYGPAEGCEGSEVLLGRGVVVLMDPEPSNTNVGVYEFVFHEESTGSKLLAQPIDHRMRISRQPMEDGLDGPDPRACFGLASVGQAELCLVFDTEEDGANFERDFNVRQRIMLLSHKAVRGRDEMSSLQGQITKLRSRGVIATTRRLLFWGCLLVVALILGYAFLLHQSQEDLGALDALSIAAQEAVSTALAVRRGAADAASVVCDLVNEGVPAADVRRCTELTQDSEVGLCVRALVRGPGAWAW